jgi:hypothetical protein
MVVAKSSYCRASKFEPTMTVPTAREQLTEAPLLRAFLPTQFGSPRGVFERGNKNVGSRGN